MVEDNLILLSIVIPVFNRKKNLNLVLSSLSLSISKNGYEDLIELVVIDDFSNKPITTSKLHLIRKLVRNNKNHGAPFSRAKGLKLSKGKFIHFHDSDDSISENWLLHIVQQLKDKPNLDILMTGRIDQDKTRSIFKYQKYFHRNYQNTEKIAKRLVYRNCLGPLGGVTFSRRVVEKVRFENFASCQDWQMYIEAIKHAKILVSRPDIHFIFNKTGDDRISHNPQKKILGHLQLAKITSLDSFFGRNIRLFYLYTCKQHIFNKSGLILKFYKKNRLSIFITFLIVSVYWRFT